MSFDKDVKVVRDQLGITQEQLAHELNISFSTINRWENGHTSPSKLARMRLIEFCIKKNIGTDIISVLGEL